MLIIFRIEVEAAKAFLDDDILKGSVNLIRGQFFLVGIPQQSSFGLDKNCSGPGPLWSIIHFDLDCAVNYLLAYDFRNQLENIYVGLKNTVSAAEIKSTCEAILSSYLAQGITVSTSDAKNGFKQLVVQINGNTVNVSVVVKLVEGIDFVLADITLQRATQTT